MIGYEVHKLPEVVAALYVMTGKLGVTLMLVSAGLAVIVVGAIFRRSPVAPATPEGDECMPDALAGTPVFYTAAENESGPTHVGGTILLETRKYLTPPARSGLSGLIPRPRSRTTAG